MAKAATKTGKARKTKKKKKIMIQKMLWTLWNMKLAN